MSLRRGIYVIRQELACILTVGSKNGGLPLSAVARPALQAQPLVCRLVSCIPPRLPGALNRSLRACKLAKNGAAGGWSRTVWLSGLASGTPCTRDEMGPCGSTLPSKQYVSILSQNLRGFNSAKEAELILRLTERQALRPLIWRRRAAAA